MGKGKSVDPLGQALVLAARRHRARQAALLSEIGLFPGQDQVLLALLADDAMTMSQIAAMLQIRPPTASKMAARMGAQGLVERRSSDSDARLVTIHVTEAGRALGERLKAIARALEKQLSADMDDKDMRRLRRLLKRAARNLKADGATLDEPEADLEDAEAA
jgi:DNA-binding MarR family transcriptional regulator